LLVTRILSAVVLAPLVLLAIYLGGLATAALVAVAGGLMGWEWARMCNGGRLDLSGGLVIAVLVLLAPFFLLGPSLTALGLLLSGAVIAQAAGRLRGEKQEGWLLPGTVYIGLACLALLWLRAVPQDGRNLVFWLLAVVWATDSGAYFAGRAIGGPRLAPRISPNKTWAGLIGGALSAALVGVLAASLLGRDATLLVVGGMVLAVVAQGGDLLESWCKRRFGVKDSSHIIPGHGGILDRVDGLLAVLLVAFLYFWAVKDPF
jgi:phosphatidate cytidylyltransferase